MDHDWRLVALSALICVATAFSALKTFEHALTATGGRRAFRLFIAGCCAGAGIWSSHFVAMLGYEANFELRFDLTLTLFSLLVSIVASTVAMFLASAPAVGRLVAGGIVLGVGMWAMHFMSTAAIELAGLSDWRPGLALTSLAIGVVFSILAFLAYHRLGRKLALPVAAMMLVIATLGLYFTAKGSVRIHPDPTDTLSDLWLDRGALALAVTTIAVFVLLSGAVLILVERLRVELDRRTRSLRQEIAERRRAELQLKAKQDLLVAHQSTMARLIHSGVDDDATLAGRLRDLVKAMCIDLDIDRSGFRILDEDGTAFVLGETYLAATDSFIALTSPEHPRVFVDRIAAVDKQAVAVDDVSAPNPLDFLRSRIFDPLDIRSLILAPIYLHGKLIGLLTCALTGRRRQWSAEHKLIISGFANLAALIVEHHRRLRLEGEARAAAGRLSHQQDVLNGLMQHDTVRLGDLDGLFSIISDTLTREMAVDRVAVRLFAESANNAATTDVHMTREKLVGEIASASLDRYPVALRAALEIGPIAIEDCAADPLARQIYETRLKPREIRAFLHAPIVVEGRLAGVVNCSVFGATRAWTTEDTLLATGVANIIALACERQLRRRAEEHLRRSKQEADEANRAKSLFLANMSHEIRTPMNGVFGMTDLLARTSLDDRQRRLLGIIGQSAKNLLTVINDILDLSRIEGGRFELHNHEFALDTCAEDSVALLAEDARKKGLDLNLLLDERAFGLVDGDPVRLRQVLLNLISNAIKFTPQGEVTVRIAPAVGDGAPDRMLFEIEDSGIGIAPEVLDRLFQPFSQADSSISRRFGGTGLGLWISRHLVSLMGGEISIASKPGAGTRIWFSLPMTVRPKSGEASRRARISLSGLRVLVVDDRQVNREIVCAYLASAGALTGHAEDGQSGIEMLRAAAENDEPFQIVIVDQVMPDMDGMTFCRQVSADPTIANVRRILLSSMSIDRAGTVLAETGVERLLAKPIRRDDLIACVCDIGGRSGPGDSDNAQADPASKPRFGLNVLLAEDNPVNQVVADEYLTTLGCTVTIVENGLQAVAAFERSGFDVVLMDCQMPEMDGLAATRLIREREAERSLPRTVIVAVTAHAFEEDRQRCLSAGMDGYLSKPFSEEQLTRTLSDISRAALLDAPAASAVQPSPHADSAPREAAVDPVSPIGGEDGRHASPVPAAREVGKPEPEPSSSSAIAALRVARPGLHAKLVRTYLDYAPNSITALDRAVRAGDTISLKVGAHALKSSSANVQAHALSELCHLLESAASDGDIELCRSLMPMLTEEFERAAELLQAEIGTKPEARTS
jgi:signal transduction histidine kinase/CheY-like chemotaxis protein/NO-binding membrane sensor protein with MHYT domain